MSERQDNDSQNTSNYSNNHIEEPSAGNSAAGEAAASPASGVPQARPSDDSRQRFRFSDLDGSVPSGALSEDSDSGDAFEHLNSPRNAQGRTMTLVLMSDDTESSIHLVRMLSGVTGDLGPAVLLLSRLAAAMNNGAEHTQGQPPASKASIDALRSLKPFQLFPKRLAKHPRCTVCQEEFSLPVATDVAAETEDDVARLECHHLFHRECISKWLGNSATCPTCRYEMLTDNEDYNVGVRKRMSTWDLGAETDDEEESICSEVSETIDPLATAAAAAEPENQLKRDRGEEHCPRHGSSGRSSRVRF
ncbi:hypothetical protein HDU86_003084 [Geranomyces michiganensis]|nr:hypothetical protein HDU86_003084 [Geranomyces michiganensis]